MLKPDKLLATNKEIATSLGCPDAHADMQGYVAELIAHCDAPCCDARKQGTLDSITKYWPDYVDHLKAA